MILINRKNNLEVFWNNFSYKYERIYSNYFFSGFSHTSTANHWLKIKLNGDAKVIKSFLHFPFTESPQRLKCGMAGQAPWARILIAKQKKMNTSDFHSIITISIQNRSPSTTWNNFLILPLTLTQHIRCSHSYSCIHFMDWWVSWYFTPI